MLDTEARKRGAEKANETRRRRRDQVEKTAILMRAAKKAGCLEQCIASLKAGASGEQ